MIGKITINNVNKQWTNVYYKEMILRIDKFACYVNAIYHLVLNFLQLEAVKSDFGRSIYCIHKIIGECAHIPTYNYPYYRRSYYYPLIINTSPSTQNFQGEAKLEAIGASSK